MSAVPFAKLVTVQCDEPLGDKGDWRVAVGLDAAGQRSAEWFRPDGQFCRVVGGPYGENPIVEEEPMLSRQIPGNWVLVDRAGKPTNTDNRLVGVVSAPARYSWSNAQSKKIVTDIGDNGEIVITEGETSPHRLWVTWLMWANKPRLKGLIIVASALPPRCVQSGPNMGRPIVPVLELQDVTLALLGLGYLPAVDQAVLSGQ